MAHGGLITHSILIVIIVLDSGNKDGSCSTSIITIHSKSGGRTAAPCITTSVSVHLEIADFNHARMSRFHMVKRLIYVSLGPQVVIHSYKVKLIKMELFNIIMVTYSYRFLREDDDH